MEDKLLENLRHKLDSFIIKGKELSEGLSVSERNIIIKKIIDESIDKAIENVIKAGEEIAENELIDREKKIRKFIEDYYNLRIKTI